MKMKLSILLLCFMALCLLSCVLFSAPEGSAEIVNTHTEVSGSTSYCTVTLKILNTSEKTIYSSNISLKASTNKNDYYQTKTYSSSILPEKSVYMTVDFSFTIEDDTDTTDETTTDEDSDSTEKDKEEWVVSSIEILDKFYN